MASPQGAGPPQSVTHWPLSQSSPSVQQSFAHGVQVPAVSVALSVEGSLLVEGSVSVVGSVSLTLVAGLDVGADSLSVPCESDTPLT